MIDTNFEEFMKIFNRYFEEVVKNETPKESKQILIETGVLDKDGKKNNQTWSSMVNVYQIAAFNFRISWVFQ